MEKPNTIKTDSPIKRNMQQHKINTKKLKPGLVASYDIRPGNEKGLFCFWHFINLSLIHLLTAPDPHAAQNRTYGVNDTGTEK